MSEAVTATQVIQGVLLRVVIPVALVGAGVVVAKELIASRKVAEREVEARSATEVEVMTLQPRPDQAIIRVTAVVEAARELALFSEIGGRVIAISDNLRLGGRIEKDEMLVRIDGRALDIAAATERNRLEQAGIEAEIESGRASIAALEWERLQAAQRERGLATAAENDAGRRLALREPQREASAISVASAKSALARVKLDKSKTVLKAPFNATVIAESIELGQYVSPATRLATLVGTDSVLIRVAVPPSRLSMINVPGVAGVPEDGGSLVTVRHQVGDTPLLRTGRVVALLGQLETQTRRAQLLVEVRDPFEVGPGEVPLLPGSFVEVELQGRSLADTIPVPRRAIFDGDQVWVVDAKNRLEQRSIVEVWRDKDIVYVTDSLRAGEKLVVGPIVMPIAGMEVKPVAGSGESQAALARKADDDGEDRLDVAAAPAPATAHGG